MTATSAGSCVTRRPFSWNGWLATRSRMTSCILASLGAVITASMWTIGQYDRESSSHWSSRTSKLSFGKIDCAMSNLVVLVPNWARLSPDMQAETGYQYASFIPLGGAPLYKRIISQYQCDGHRV